MLCFLRITDFDYPFDIFKLSCTPENFTVDRSGHSVAAAKDKIIFQCQSGVIELVDPSLSHFYIVFYIYILGSGCGRVV